MEKLKIENGEAYFESYVSRLRIFAGQVAEVKTAWNKLADLADMPRWSNETFQHCMTTGTRALEDAVDTAIARKDRVLQKLYREELSKPLNEVWGLIQSELNNSSAPWHISTSSEYVPRELRTSNKLPLVDGEISITKEYLNEIRLLFDKHLVHPDDIELYHKHEAVREAWNDLVRFAKKKEYRLEPSIDRNFGLIYAVELKELSSIASKTVPFKQIV